MAEVIKFIAPWVGGKDIAVNLVASAIWGLITSAIIYFFKRKSQLPLRIFYLATIYKFIHLIKDDSDKIDGFYYAIYDSSKSKKEGNSISNYNVQQGAAPTSANNSDCDNEKNKGTKVAECIYISTAVSSNTVTGYVFRRAKRKNGNMEQNNFYFDKKLLNKLRIVGRYSYSLKIFFGYWLDPYKPKAVAGTVRLKWFDNNIAIEEHLRKKFLVGHWDGVVADIDKMIPINLETQEYYGFAQTGGEWHFHHIGLGISEFREWHQQLTDEGDTAANPSIFLDWSPK